jgi:methyltransferase (TIGR00027 family)
MRLGAALALCTLLTPASRALEPGQPSKTAVLAAAARAFGARDHDAIVRNPDWLADPLLGPAELVLIASHPLSHTPNQDYRIASLDPDVVSVTRLNLLRTRFIDERLERAVRGGAIQVVILGAGFDTRAYRFRRLLRDATVIEIDNQPTQSLKRRRIEEVLGGPPPNLRYAPMDLGRQKLGDVLGAAGFRPDAQTVFIWEAGSMYVPEEVVRDTLRTVAHAAAGSSLLMDYASASAVQTARTDPASSQTRWDAAWSEPWVFGIPDGRQEPFFRELGLEPAEILNLNSREAAERYLTRRDKSVFGAEPGQLFKGPEAHSGLALAELIVGR